MRKANPPTADTIPGRRNKMLIGLLSPEVVESPKTCGPVAAPKTCGCGDELLPSDLPSERPSDLPSPGPPGFDGVFVGVGVAVGVGVGLTAQSLLSTLHELV